MPRTLARVVRFGRLYTHIETRKFETINGDSAVVDSGKVCIGRIARALDILNIVIVISGTRQLAAPPLGSIFRFFVDKRGYLLHRGIEPDPHKAIRADRVDERHGRVLVEDLLLIGNLLIELGSFWLKNLDLALESYSESVADQVACRVRQLDENLVLCYVETPVLPLKTKCALDRIIVEEGCCLSDSHTNLDLFGVFVKDVWQDALPVTVFVAFKTDWSQNLGAIAVLADLQGVL